ncbi:SigE family RNA polymerase sigma factor [Asanoa iriomotensis]|uniref:RNA polymerase sigma24 factor n=1 Tax=Asanoa iriomotensis TaxID=234613 RepID=A0ABQ4C804_9ACTN|nr:SigE family RNA polymerase sigma factor [Asanoa iriomotensis]GIF58890.1 RNA polymerase sigma24 factor [Asanoa iriomotensis]
MNRDAENEYREFVASRLDSLRRMAYLLCRDWHTADDLVSITIGKLYRNWRRVGDARNVDAYVRRVLTHAWLDERRRPWRREHSVDELPDQEARVAEPTVADREVLLHLLAQLPPRRKAVVVLRYYCDLSVEETAEILGITTGAVKSQAARALEALRLLATTSTGGTA